MRKALVIGAAAVAAVLLVRPELLHRPAMGAAVKLVAPKG